MAEKTQPLIPIILPRQGEEDDETINDKWAKAQDAINQNMQILMDLAVRALNK